MTPLAHSVLMLVLSLGIAPAVLAGPAYAHSSARPQPPPAIDNANAVRSGGSTSNSDINAYLSAHNSVRAQHDASPLTWSDDLAKKAQQWADGCLFRHSGGTLGRFGENLAAGTGAAYDIDTAVKSWADESCESDLQTSLQTV